MLELTEANVKTNPVRIFAILAVVVLLLALIIAALAVERGDLLMILLGLLLAATSMELFRRADPPTS
jgi:hypothetical protein